MINLALRVPCLMFLFTNTLLNRRKAPPVIEGWSLGVPFLTFFLYHGCFNIFTSLHMIQFLFYYYLLLFALFFFILFSFPFSTTPT